MEVKKLKVGYIQARHIKDIEAFQMAAHADKVVVELLNEYDQSITNGEVFEQLLSEMSPGDVIILQGLSNLPFNNISELYSFLGRIKELAIEVQLINESDGKVLLSEEGYKVLSYLQGYIQQKDSQNQRKIGRPAKEFPVGFYEVYLDYRDKKIKADEAADILKLHKSKFYELVRLFES